MNSLFLITEMSTNGYLTGVLDIISMFAIFCSIFILVNRNPIVSVLFLIGLFGCIASYLIMIGLNFIGFSYLITYVGAVSILFLFILMLINIRISELQSNTSNSIPLAVLIVIALNYPVFQLLPYNIIILNNYYNLNSILYNLSSLNQEKNSLYFNTYDDISFVTSKIWDGNLLEQSHISSVGNVLYTNYNLWLLITAFILLLAMIGSIVISQKPKN